MLGILWGKPTYRRVPGGSNRRPLISYSDLAAFILMPAPRHLDLAKHWDPGGMTRLFI